MKWLATPVAVLLVVVAVAYGVHKVKHDPSLAFLYDHDGAQWIRLDEPVTLKARPASEITHGYRATFKIEKPPASAVLHVQGMRAASVFLDGECVLEPPTDLMQWKEVRTVDLAPRLTPGTHAVRVMVFNWNGPACLIAYCRELGLYSGTSWDASGDGRTWTAAIPVRQALRYEPAQRLMTVAEVFMQRLPMYLIVFAAALACSLKLRRHSAIQAVLRPDMVRWILLGGWLVLSANNMWKLAPFLGFDHDGHLKYIQYVAQTWRIPLANEGWQMFQSPLYYLISAPLFLLLDGRFVPESVECMLRIVPILCGAVQIELCYRTARRVFPERGDLQTLTVLIGGLMPMNLYLSQYLSNEPLAGFLIGWVVLLTIPLLREPKAFRLRQCVPLGLVLGLALLAKVTALLIAFPLVFALVFAGCTGGETPRRMVTRCFAAVAIVFGLAGVIAGWYYLRNYMELGRLFIGGWDAARGIEWWQVPGYRTPNQLLAFGDVFIRPVFCGIYSFWDGIYATLWTDGFISGMAEIEAMPPWNYGWLLPGVWLALLPTCAIVVGVVATVRHPLRACSSGLILAVLCVGIYFAALLQHFLANPFFCAVKAFYALGALSSLALLAAVGFEKMLHWKPAQAVIHALLACWAVSVYLGFFVW